MTQATSQPLIRMPMRRLAVAEILAWALSGGIALGLAVATGHADGAWMGAIATLVGLVGGLLIVALIPSREAFNWAVAQVSASTVRMIATLAIGFGLYRSLEPDKTGFWGVLLLTSLGVLAGEVMIFLPVLRGSSRASGARGSVTEASA